MKLTDILGIKYPILQGAMAQISKEPLVSTVSNSGGLGILASGGKTIQEIKDELKLIRSRTTNPFAVNIMLMDANADQMAQLVIEEKVPIVTTGAGTPKKYFNEWKKAGIIVVPVVPSVKIAKKMEELGVDALIVEGTEAGGHIGATASLALWPQVVDAVSIPVIAAGGVADGRGFLAALIMGCVGVQIGTRFLITKECPIGPKYKNQIITATDSSTIVTGQTRGDSVRALKNKMTLAYSKLEMNGASEETLNQLGTGGLKKAVVEDDIENGSVMAGQISGLIDHEETVEELILSIITDAKKRAKAFDLDSFI